MSVIPRTVGFPFKYVNMYLFRNRVQPLKKYHKIRNVIARKLVSPFLLFSTLSEQFSIIFMWLFLRFLSIFSIISEENNFLTIYQHWYGK